MTFIDLTIREQEILRSVIHAYITTAEPVASKILVMTYNLGVSSATIRNVMNRLEQKGLIRQLHTSSGRVPTDLGYRFYVNHLMTVTHLSPEETLNIENEMVVKHIDVDLVLKQSALALARLTGFMAIVGRPIVQRECLLEVKLLAVDERRVVIIAMFADGVVREKVVILATPLSTRELVGVALLVKDALQGKIELNTIKAPYQSVVRDMVQLDLFEEKNDVIIEGQSNVTQHPDFSSYEQLSQLVKLVEDGSVLQAVLDESSQEDCVNIYIGEKDRGFEDYSIVTASYRIGAECRGSLGVVGPKRMAYAQVIPIVETLACSVTKCLN